MTATPAIPNLEKASQQELIDIIVSQQTAIDALHLVVETDRELIDGYRKTLDVLTGLKNAG